MYGKRVNIWYTKVYHYGNSDGVKERDRIVKKTVHRGWMYTHLLLKRLEKGRREKKVTVKKKDQRYTLT